MQIEITLLIAILGGFVSLARSGCPGGTKIANDSKWRGGVDAKLDTILGIKATLKKLDCKVDDHEHRITAVEESAKQAHKRIDHIQRPLGGEPVFILKKRSYYNGKNYSGAAHRGLQEKVRLGVCPRRSGRIVFRGYGKAVFLKDITKSPLSHYIKECAKWFGKHVVDCSGLIIEAFRDYLPSYGDMTANGLYDRCLERGQSDDPGSAGRVRLEERAYRDLYWRRESH